MRIILLNDDSLPTARGGAAVVVETLRRELIKRGHQVTLITTHQDADRPKIDRRRDDAGEIISIFRRYPLSQRHRRCLFDQEMHDTLSALFKELRPEIVHAHNVHTYLTYDALRVAHDVGAKVILTAHDTFLISFGRIGGPGFRQRALIGAETRPQWFHHLIAVGRKYWPLRNFTIKGILRQNDVHVVAISIALQRFLFANGIKSTVIPNGTPVRDDVPDVNAAKARFGCTGPTILFGGRIGADKGIDALLKAFDLVVEKLPSAKLVVMGERERLQPHLASATDRVRRAVISTGWLSRSDARQAFTAADVVTTPSIYLDPFNLINIEAMAMGKPVVGTCFGGTPEIVQNGTTGFICNPLETKSFADALLKLLTNRTLAAELGAAGRQRLEKEFSSKMQMERYLEFFSA